MIGVSGDRFDTLAEVTKRLAALGEEISALAEVRRSIVRDLHADGYSQRHIARSAGLTSSRISQIVNESKSGRS